MNIQVVAHSSFLGETGYNAHSQAIFTALNKYLPVRVRNYSYTNDLSVMSKEQMDIIIEQNWNDPPHKIGSPFNPNPKDILVNIVLNETNHYFFYDHYDHPLIFYNVWESTKQPPEFFNRMLQADQFWCPTEFQRQCTIDQGYPEDRVKVVPEGVNGRIFCPTTKSTSIRNKLYKKYNIPKDKFSFMLFGRWDYRKSITEVIQAFLEEFKDDDKVILIASVDNPFSVDGLKTTEERLKHNKLESEKIKILHFPDRSEYVNWIKSGHVFLCCPRSEGWNLPLIEAIASGTPSICSDWGAHLEFADGIAYKVNVPIEKSPDRVFNIKPAQDLGVWGEPDFDHLKKVMRTVYNEYSEAKQFANNASKGVREKFSWDNAAMTAETYIQELATNFKPIPKPVNKDFETSFEIIDGSPRVTFKSSVNFDDMVLARVKDSDGTTSFETWFEKIDSKVNYWIALNKQVDNITFELINKDLECIYSETKHLNEVKNTIQENTNEMELYQDQYVNGSVIVKGKRDCNSRYEAMKPVFEKYNRPFTILDIGANFGYYSIRAATEYDAISVMIENKDSEINTLTNICEQNDCKDKLIVLQTGMNLHKLKELSKCEHFDVVLALNVIHHFNKEEIPELCEVFTKLGDNLILETPPVDDVRACGQNNLKSIVNYFDSIVRTSLGKFERHTSDTMSDLFWFKTPRSDLKWPYYEYEKLFDNKDLDVKRLKERGVNTIESDFDSKKITSTRRDEVRDWIAGINLKTFIKLNGVYPSIYDIVEKLKIRDIRGDYKWDNTNNDLVTHNFILNGHSLHIIDFDDKLIEREIFDDKLQIETVIRELIESKNIIPDIVDEEKIKLNLGCGNDIKDGYINIDRYNNTGNVDMSADIGNLPFENESVDEIYTSHVFEHIPINEIYGVVEEWKRVLKPNGDLILRLPNLEHEINIWLNTPDEDKWTEVYRIFGAQSHPGNTHFCGFNLGSLSSFIKSFDFEIVYVRDQNKGHGNEIGLHAKKKESSKKTNVNYTCHFVDGPFVNIQGEKTNNYFILDFLDPEANASVHQQLLKVNSWTRPHRKYYTDWLVQIRRNGKLDFEHCFDLKNKNVLISFDTKGIGDTIAWIPYIEEFRNKHNCNIWISTFWNKLFQGHKNYSKLNFIPPGRVVENLYASYSVGCYDNDRNKNKINWRLLPLQKVCTDVLGLDYKEIVPEINFKNRGRRIKEKYVTISEFSTFQCKFWNRPGGWQEIVDYLNEIGLKVMVISKEKTNLKNIINRTNRTIEESMNNIYHSEFCIGVSSGPAWLAWALKVPVVMISGYSKAMGEFHTGVKRVINEDVCHGCFNRTDLPFERGDWNWCPIHKGTPRQFECTKQITPEMVKEAIGEIIKERKFNGK